MFVHYYAYSTEETLLEDLFSNSEVEASELLNKS